MYIYILSYNHYMEDIKFSMPITDESFISTSKGINESCKNSKEKSGAFDIKTYMHQNKSSSTNDSSFIEEDENKEMTELLNELNGKVEIHNDSLQSKNVTRNDNSEFLEISVVIQKPRTSLPCLKNKTSSVNSNKINMKGRILIGSQNLQVNFNENQRRATVVNKFDVRC